MLDRGWKKPVLILDESYVCVNHVMDKTLHDKAGGEKVHRQEGAGKRICMGGCGVLYGNEDHGLQAEWLGQSDPAGDKSIGLGWFQFAAEGGGLAGKGVTNQELKDSIKQLNPKAGVSGKNKKDLIALYKQLTQDVATQQQQLAALDDFDKKLKANEDAALSEEEAGSIDRFDYNGNFDAERCAHTCCCSLPFLRSDRSQIHAVVSSSLQVCAGPPRRL